MQSCSMVMDSPQVGHQAGDNTNKILAPQEVGTGVSAAWQCTTSAWALKIGLSTDKKVTASCTYDLLLKHTFFLGPGNVL